MPSRRGDHLTALAETTNPLSKTILRGPATWYCYLLFGFFAYLLNIQGNVIPFLKSELDLSFWTVSLHSSAFALGMIAVGLIGDWVRRRLGRSKTLWLAVGGMATGAVLLCVARAAWASIASCAVLGLFGSLMPCVLPAILADIHGEKRDTAFAELSAISQGFGMLAPLMTGLVLWLALGWRYAVIGGAVFGGLVLLRFRQLPLIEAAPAGLSRRWRMPAPYWAYWGLGIAAISLEFSILLWAPTFLEHVTGFRASWAAIIAAGFPLGLVLGRVAIGVMVHHVSVQYVFVSALLVTLIGFGLYWGIDNPAAVLAGIFALGLGIGPLYPLTLNFAIGAAPGATDAASARFMLAVGIAILLAPATLGSLADAVGLRLAHLTVPALVAAAFVCFLAAQALQGRNHEQKP
jgi:fucose permease